MDAEYKKARETLIDCLEALQNHLESVVIVGAQAIYLQVPQRKRGPQQFTSDADVAVIPDKLGGPPAIADALEAKGFVPDPAKVGTWSKNGVGLDVMVPDALGGPGRRGARLPLPHGKRVARKAMGLEGIIADRRTVMVESLDGSRRIEANVAGPAALIVSKMHKIEERLAVRPDQLSNKDAHDVWRLLDHTPTEELADRFERLLASDIAAKPTKQALRALHAHFIEPTGHGRKMIIAAEAQSQQGEEIGAQCARRVQELLLEMSQRSEKHKQKIPGPGHSHGV